MNITLALYLVDIISNLDCILAIIIICIISVILIFIIIYIMALGSYDNHETDKINKLFQWLGSKWWVCLIIISLAIITPSKSTMHLMLGTYYLQSTNLPAKVTEALELKLDDVIADLKGKK